jgi:hypothetical protein
MVDVVLVSELGPDLSPLKVTGVLSTATPLPVARMNFNNVLFDSTFTSPPWMSDEHMPKNRATAIRKPKTLHQLQSPYLSLNILSMKIPLSYI